MTASFLLWARPYIVAIGGAVSVLAATWLGVRKSARTEAKLKDAEQTIKQHEVRNEVDADSRRGNARDRLRSSWRE